ncbi:MAG: glycosyltransferase [Geobacteraceae bacterium]|nr:glycosyltransferase [Geobacteraceae bacterium]
MQVDVAFITVNYNTCALVEELIRFFKAVELPFSYRLVVVDNNSTDGSQAMLEQEHWDGLLYIQTNENLGYGRGMNRGLQAVSSRYACIMNTDLILNQEALAVLWSFFEARPEAGVASPVIMGSDNRVQGFLFLPSIWSLYSQTISKIRSKSWKLRVEKATAPLAVPGVLGAFFMIRRDLFPGSLFDEDFFFYYEDSELAHWQRGIPCFVLPQVSIIHLGGQSTSAEGGRLFQESRRIYLEKCYGSPHTVLLALLDRLRLRGKYYKYLVLHSLIKSSKIQSKYDFYARLIQLTK